MPGHTAHTCLCHEGRSGQARDGGATSTLAGGAAAGHVEDPQLTAFACALRDAKVMDLDDGMQLISFGPSSFFPDDVDLHRSDLVARDFYNTLFERISSMRSSLLTGIPGTGKSWWIWYAIHRLLNQGPSPAIVWQTFKRGTNDCVLFKDGKAFVGDLSGFKSELADASTWYFVDGMLPSWVAARTVMVSSPKREVYKEWIKGRRYIILTMPLWTRSETEVLWKALYADKLTLERALRNFDVWYGGVPRLVMEDPARQSDESQDKEDALSAIQTTNIEQVLAAVTGAYDTGPEASHRVIHQDGDRITFKRLGPKFATSHVGDLFAQQAQSRGMLARLMSLLASSTNMHPNSRGHFFEVLKHNVMCSGGRMAYRFLDVPGGISASGRKGRPSSKYTDARQAALDAATTVVAQAHGSTPGQPLLITIPALEQRTFEADSVDAFGAAVQQCSSPCYLRPDAADQPIFDACIYPDTLLQFTVSPQKEGVNEELLERYLECLPPQEQYYLDYVVPADVYKEFKASPLKRGALPRVSKTYVRVVKVQAVMQSTMKLATKRRRLALTSACVRRLAHVGWV